MIYGQTRYSLGFGLELVNRGKEGRPLVSQAKIRRVRAASTLILTRLEHWRMLWRLLKFRRTRSDIDERCDAPCEETRSSACSGRGLPMLVREKTKMRFCSEDGTRVGLCAGR